MTQPAPETVNPANEADAPAPSDTVKLRVADAWVTEFNTVDSQGGKLTVTRKGTEVPASDKDNLIKQAAAHGVTLAEVSK